MRLTDDEIRKQVELGYEAKEYDVDLAIDRRVSQATADKIKRDIQQILNDWDNWTDEEGGEDKFQAKYGEPTTNLISVIEDYFNKD